jgi:hypothetical protein
MLRAKAHVRMCVERHGRNRNVGNIAADNTRHHGRDRDDVKVVIACGCVQGRHRSVAMAEMLRAAIDRPHIGTATCHHNALWQSSRGECGCGQEDGCFQLRRGIVDQHVTRQWAMDRAEAHANAVDVWDYE